MKANPIYPQIIEDYKQYLRSGHVKRISFTGFCRPYNVRLKSVQQWMKRHGMDITTLRYETLLEEGAINNGDVESTAYGPVRECIEIGHSCKSKESPDQIQGATITFPDGLIVSIRQTSPRALTRFLESYNKLIRLRDV